MRSLTKQSLCIVRAGRRNLQVKAAIKQELITVIEIIYADGIILSTFCITKARSLGMNLTVGIENIAKSTKLTYSKKG